MLKMEPTSRHTYTQFVKHALISQLTCVKTESKLKIYRHILHEKHSLKIIITLENDFMLQTYLT